MKRREFLTRSAGAALVLSLAPSLLVGCDDGGEMDDDQEGTDEGTEGAEGTDGEGTEADTSGGADECMDCADAVAEGPSETHGHLICLTQADLDGGEDITFTSTGGSHDHTFVITAAQLQAIADGEVVAIDSNDTHPHVWDVSLCA